MKNRIRALILFLALIACVSIPSYAQETQTKQEEFAGEFSGWGVKVPLGNYYFVKGTISVFGTRWGPMPQTKEDWEDRIWEQLALSYEAFRRDIKVDQKDLEEEITKTINNEKVPFDWKKDKEAYGKWLKERIGEPAELFENQLRHLLQLEKLRQQVMDSIKPTVTEQEAYQKFLNEYNTLELDLVQFDELKDAQAFYDKMLDPKLWDEELKKDPKFAKHPGFVSLEFLMDMWKVPKDDLYKMLKMEVNSVYPPAPVYKGYGVFRILQKRLAQDADFSRQRESYMKQVEMIKKYEGLQSWLKQLKVEAKIKAYPLPNAASKPSSDAKAETGLK
jgi:hypothetical protein